MNKVILSPSLLSSDFTRLGEQIGILEKSGIKALHFDVMDGVFVPNISFGIPVLKSIRKNCDMILDVHMMVTEPESKIEDFIKAGADIITVHAEASIHLDRALRLIRDAGKKAGVALNPATPVSVLEEILPETDMVLIMSVNPGFGGQKYIPYCTEKIKKLRKTADMVNPNLSIQVDGGINPDTLKTVLEAGADNIVAGSAVFSGDIEENVSVLMKEIGDYERKS